MAQLTRQQAIAEMLEDRTAAQQRVATAARSLENAGDGIFDDFLARAEFDEAVADLAVINEDPTGCVDIIEAFSGL